MRLVTSSHGVGHDHHTTVLRPGPRQHFHIVLHAPLLFSFTHTFQMHRCPSSVSVLEISCTDPGLTSGHIVAEVTQGSCDRGTWEPTKTATWLSGLARRPCCFCALGGPAVRCDSRGWGKQGQNNFR